ncbi:MAG TPA: transcriptional regulator NrdR [Patescibacteria group bacterium]|nr:transcriptional regulator NrdR [Patescibacteria group bacterium]
MRCPFCGYLDSKVIDKRDNPDLSATRRRRECLSCQKRFSTHERVETVDLLVQKKDGRREPFNPEKIRTGLFKALEKRPVSTELVNLTALEIEQEIRKQNQTEVPTKIIGELIMKKLKRLDQVAYIRFASVYKNFTEVKDFEAALKELVDSKKKH